MYEKNKEESESNWTCSSLDITLSMACSVILFYFYLDNVKSTLTQHLVEKAWKR